MEMEMVLALQNASEDQEPLPDCCCSTVSAGCICPQQPVD